jgi:uncharacterized protein (DUF1810 family)
MPDTADPFDLQRFLDAQQADYATACAELRAGRKRSHWIWYVFPQIEGLGASSMSQRYAIRSGDEARAYLEHPILGARLRECTALVERIQGGAIRDIFGSPDDAKFRSCMTLFAATAAEDGGLFQRAIDKWFAGEPDPFTIARLRSK